MLALRLMDTGTSQIHQDAAGKAGKRAIRPHCRMLLFIVGDRISRKREQRFCDDMRKETMA